MSELAQPYSKVARGRLPKPAWMRIAVVATALVLIGGAMSVGLSYLDISHPREHEQPSHPIVAAPPLDLPVQAPPPAAVASITQLTPAAPAVPAAPTAHLMRMWHVAAKETPQQRQEQGQGRPGTASEHGSSDTGTDEYSQRLQAGEFVDGSVSLVKDRSLLLSEGKVIPCLPQSPMDTQLVGGISCVIDENVWSDDGTNILFHAHAAVAHGRILRGLTLGQNRAFILWTEIDDGPIKARINSPTADALGQVGVDGVVDEHLWQQVKAALLLTGVETAGNAAQALAARGNGNTYLNFSQGTSLAEQMLSHNINIPPTLWRGQAWPLSIYVQRDVPFRRVFKDVLVAGR